MNRKGSFIADQRGAVAFEFPFIYVFLFLVLLVPIADVAIAGWYYVSAWQALRAFGQSVLYSPPPDVTDAATWKTGVLAKANAANPRYQIPSIQLICGDSSTACSSGNTASPKYYSYSTTVTLTPVLMTSALCTNGGANPCAFTLTYMERFQ